MGNLDVVVDAMYEQVKGQFSAPGLPQEQVDFSVKSWKDMMHGLLRQALDGQRGVFNFPNFLDEQLDSKQYWPGDDDQKKYEDETAKFMKAMAPIVTFVETAAFAIPEFGVFASAAIGALWQAVQPGSLHLYQQPLSDMVGQIVESALSQQVLVHARSDLDQFNGFFKAAAAGSIPKSSDDISHTKTMITDFEGYVNPGGLLLKAFYDAKDNLPWFDASGHTLVITAMQDVLQACKIRLMCWQQVAMLERHNGNVTEYNKAQYEVILLVARIPGLIVEMQAAVLLKIHTMQQARIAGLSVQWDTQETANFTSHRQHPGDTYRIRGWVYDAVSKRRIFQAGLQDTPTEKKVLDGLGAFFGAPTREDGSKDDENFGQIMSMALVVYSSALLPPNINTPFEQLIAGMQTVVTQAATLGTKTAPGTPAHGALVIPNVPLVTVPQKVSDSLQGASKVSFRFDLRPEKDGAVFSASPWSDFVEIKDGKIAPMYIGDGYAAVNTMRKIYLRTADTDTSGIEVASLTGHGIMTWPQEKVAAPV